MFVQSVFSVQKGRYEKQYSLLVICSLSLVVLTVGKALLLRPVLSVFFRHTLSFVKCCSLSFSHIVTYNLPFIYVAIGSQSAFIFLFPLLFINFSFISFIAHALFFCRSSLFKSTISIWIYQLLSNCPSLCYIH